jgi:SP family sugar:H+ symporter-like MFS transporter
MDKYSGPMGRVREFMASFNGRLAYACIMIAFSAVNFGMDQGAFNSTIAMKHFVRQFGTYNSETDSYALTARFLSMLNSIPYVGCIFGLLTGNLVNRKLGRKVGLAVMCSWAIVSSIVLCTAETQGQILAGRIIAYAYIGTTTALVPVFLSELVPARVRGFIVGTYQSGLLVCCPGSILC